MIEFDHFDHCSMFNCWFLIFCGKSLNTCYILGFCRSVALLCRDLSRVCFRYAHDMPICHLRSQPAKVKTLGTSWRPAPPGASGNRWSRCWEANAASENSQIVCHSLSCRMKPCETIVKHCEALSVKSQKVNRIVLPVLSKCPFSAYTCKYIHIKKM